MRHVWAWTPPLLIALAIAWLGGRPEYPGGISLAPPMDKLAHAAAFGTLAFFLELALRRTRHDLPMYQRHGWILLAVALSGAADEFHQSFVPGRDCSALDWLADLSGAFLGPGLAMVPFLCGRRQARFGWWRGTRRRPEPGRPLILVADPHWREDLTGLEEVTRRCPGADWLFLGDIFEVWLGLPGLETEAQRAFLWWVRERREAGRWVGLWMGNRDYFLDRLSGQFDLIGEGTGGALPEERLAFEHGDLVNGKDRGYRLWNLCSRSGLAWLLVGLLPDSLVQRLTMGLEGSMRAAQRGCRGGFPRAAFAAAAAEHPGSTFLTGHFHTHEEEGTGIALPWAHEGAFALWDGDRVELLDTPPGSDATFPVPDRPSRSRRNP